MHRSGEDSKTICLHSYVCNIKWLSVISTYFLFVYNYGYILWLISLICYILCDFNVCCSYNIMYIFMLKIIYFTNVLYVPLCIFLTVGGAMHFIYYINRLTATKVDSTYFVCLTSKIVLWQGSNA